MPILSKPLRQLPVLLALLTLLILSAHALPTLHVSQLSSPSNDLSPRTQPLYSAGTALTNHAKRAFVTQGTFFRGLWSLALTTTTFLAQGPSSSTAPASDIEYFAQQVLDKVARRIAAGAAETNAFGWVLDGVSITFASWLDHRTYVAPGVPWGVVQEFLTKFVLWRAQRGTVMAFSGHIWGPGGECVTVVLKVMEATGAAEVASSIMDSASEIHGVGSG